MMQSNNYILLFTGIMTIVLGGLLSFTSTYLQPLQKKQIDLDTKKKILATVTSLSDFQTPDEILNLYDQRFVSKVINLQGEEIKVDEEGNPLVAEEINIQKNYKLAPEKRKYPIFIYQNEKSEPESYIFPMFGNGLWDWISVYVALSGDMNTILGVSFDHKAETPGLGARIASSEVQDRFKAKKIFDETGQLQSVRMLRGEKGLPLGPHEVDGMSGATLTGRGVTQMLKSYFSCYAAYILKKKRENKSVR
ncbi:MAG: NADH:ubiquinone reductase (Na(+)-transporting) subunit C [Cytophagales bacterium]|nr:NADH:ubiquinone reductase (Na(+)-transporting) subunit C [Cytophagales bacterium]